MLQRITCDTCGWWADAALDAPPNDPNILPCRCCQIWHEHAPACRPVSLTLLYPAVIPG